MGVTQTKMEISISSYSIMYVIVIIMLLLLGNEFGRVDGVRVNPLSNVSVWFIFCLFFS